jgi:AcrR family transcriptional regulator
VNGFERRKEQKKEAIRRAAAELFRSHGFEKVSLADIARRAHVSHVTIYNHFGSKEALVRDVVKTAIAGLVAMSREIIESDRPFAEKLELIVFGKVTVAGQYQGELMQTALRDTPEMQDFIEGLWRQEVDRLITELIEDGKRQGAVRRDLPNETIRLYFRIIRDGAFASLDLLQRLNVDAKLARDLNHLFLYGLVAKKP